LTNLFVINIMLITDGQTVKKIECDINKLLKRKKR
jgi:hypothetical protein